MTPRKRRRRRFQPLTGEFAQLDPDPTDVTTAPIAAAPVLLTSAFRTLAARAAMLILSFIFSILVARALTPSSRGDFALLQALTGLAVVGGNFAVAKGIIYHIGKKSLPVARANSAAISLGLLSGVLVTLALLVPSLGTRDALLGGAAPILVIGSLMLATPQLIREYLMGTMVAVGRPLDVILCAGSQPLISLAILVTLMVGTHVALESVFVAWAVGIAASALVALMISYSYSRSVVFPRKSDLSALGRFGLRTYPALLASFMNLRLDHFLVGAVSSSATVGQYAVAVSLAEVLLRFASLIILASSGAISSAAPQKSASLTAQLTRWMILVMTAGALPFALLAPAVVPVLFGANYDAAVLSIILLLPGMVLYSSAAIIWEYFVVQRARLRTALVIALSSLAVGTLFTLLLTPLLGAAGASIASTLGYATMFFIAIFFFSRDSGLPPSSALRLSGDDVRSILSALRGALRRP